MTHRQRFFPEVTNFTVYAPLTIGCPAMLHQVDRSVFKKTQEEKVKLFSLKKSLKGKTKHHKFSTYLKVSF